MDLPESESIIVGSGMLDLQENYKDVFDGRIGFGKTPAIVVVDFVKGYTTEGAPLYAQDVVAAVAESRDLLQQARNHSVPVIFTRVVYHPTGFDGGLWVKKIPVLRTLTETSEASQFCDELLPEKDEVVIKK